jgi:hydrogenase-4 component B
MIRTDVYNLIQLLFVIAFGPLYAGVLSRFKENVQSKRGSPSYSFVALAPLLLAWFVVTRLTRRRAVAQRALWAAGIPRLLPQMTYNATGFSNPVRVVFQAIFQPNITQDTRQTVAVHFRTAIHRQREERNVVDRLFLQPVGAATR